MAMCKTREVVEVTILGADVAAATLPTEVITTTFMATMCTVTTIMRPWRRECMLSRAIREGIETIWDTLTMRETRLGVVEVAMDSTTTILRVPKVDAIEAGEALVSTVRRTSTSMKATMREDGNHHS